MTEPGQPRPAFAPWDRRELPGLFGVTESARRVGNYKWIEMRLFEALGGWVATVPELDVKLANDAMVAFVDAVREPEAPELTIEKLVGVYRVLIPRKIAAYTFHLNATSRITDAPTRRSLNFILQDELDDWREGEMLLQSLIATPEEVERAATRQRELEGLMLAAGGITGPGSIGMDSDANASEGVAVG